MGNSLWSRDNSQYSCELYDSKYYQQCAVGGALASGLSHLALTPVDLVKCQMQLDACTNGPLIKGLRTQYCAGNIYRGWQPTLFGYALHGAIKFPSYEFFKHKFSEAVGEESAYIYRTWIFLAASASAEILATLALTPFEHMKIRMQTNAAYTTNMYSGYRHIRSAEGWKGFFRGVQPLLLRQVPHTMMKFATFELSMDMLYKYVVPKPREECSQVAQLAVTFAAGYISGALCALVSHPADTIVTRMFTVPDTTFSYIKKNHGRCIWWGLGPRIVLIGSISGLQWTIFDWFRHNSGLPPPPTPEMPSSLQGKGYT